MPRPFCSSSMLRLRYGPSCCVRYQTQTRYRSPVESRCHSPSSDSSRIETALSSFSRVNAAAALPYSSTLPVISGVLTARKRPLRGPLARQLGREGEIGRIPVHERLDRDRQLRGRAGIVRLHRGGVIDRLGRRGRSRRLALCRSRRRAARRLLRGAAEAAPAQQAGKQQPCDGGRLSLHVLLPASISCCTRTRRWRWQTPARSWRPHRRCPRR